MVNVHLDSGNIWGKPVFPEWSTVLRSWFAIRTTALRFKAFG